jgi:AmmeMemoRadiSam system protein B
MMRTCAVAGMFYPRDPSHLEQLLEKFFSGIRPDRASLGIVSPGFSGTFVVIGPSHRGYINCVSTIPWETPLGVVDTDNEFVEALDIETDEFSHRDEHSLEVQVPFIKYRFPRAQIAPVMMGQQDYSSAMRLSEKIGEAIKRTKRDVRIVASSDFSHYVPEQKAKSDDLYAIEPLLNLDTKEFYRRIEERRVTACGYGPIAAMVTTCKNLGAKTAQLIQYATSGDVTGDRREVVGYAAITVM